MVGWVGEGIGGIGVLGGEIVLFCKGALEQPGDDGKVAAFIVGR